MPRLCSDVRMLVVRKWTKKISFTKKSSDLHQEHDGVASMIKNCSSKKIADENLISTTASNCTSTTYNFVANKLEMSPKKALRAAMLKRRFADTIFKATHHDEIRDEIQTTKQARSELEKERIKEKRRIEAEFKAAQQRLRAATCTDRSSKRRRLLVISDQRAAARMALENKAAQQRAATCTDHNSKRRRLVVISDQRDAARMALEKMQMSVHIDNDNAGFFKELQMSMGDSAAYDLFYGKTKFVGNPLGDYLGWDEQDPLLLVD